MYAIILIAISAIFNNTAERVVRQDIDDLLKAESQRVIKSGKFNVEQLEQWKAKRRAELIHKYYLDRPFLFRVFMNAYKAFTFNYGNSMIMRSSKGDREVWKILIESLPKTAILFTTDFFIVTFVGILMGLKMARKPGGALDKTVSFFCFSK